MSDVVIHTGPMFRTRKQGVTMLWNELEETIVNLWMRWQDEKGHEDIRSYDVAVKETVEKYGGFEFIRFTQRPFGIRFKVSGVMCRITFNGRDYKWEAIR